jgi:nucleoside-diphosphate-sugar epimerase
MRIFITGGTGFIGRYTLKELKKRGHHLLVLSHKTYSEHAVDFIKGDFSDIPKWKERLKKFKPEAAVHLVWEGIPDFSYAQSVKNLEGGLALFAAFVEAGCKKIVAIGAGFECGNHVGKVSEKINVTPTTSITAAKYALYLMGEELAKEKGMDFIWLRPFNPYGHGQRFGSLMPQIMRCVEKKIPLTLKNPLAQGDFIYVADVARAITDAVLRGKGRAIYNIGSGRLTPVRDIAIMICEKMGASKTYCNNFARTAKGKLLNAPYADLKNIQKGIRWRPTTDIQTGIQKIIKDYRNSLRK